MSPYTNCHAPRTSLSGRIQKGHKSGLLLFIIIIYSVNIKPSRHRFGFSLAWDWQYSKNNLSEMFFLNNFFFH
jgi:hypothetical protein